MFLKIDNRFQGGCYKKYRRICVQLYVPRNGEVLRSKKFKKFEGENFEEWNH